MAAPVAVSRFAVGFVGEHDLGLLDEGASNRDSLLLASGELIGALPGLVLEPDGAEHRERPVAALGSRCPDQEQWIFDVFKRPTGPQVG